MICERCIFGCPWNGKGWGCSHPSYQGLIVGKSPPCAGAEFRQTQPWHWPPKGSPCVETPTPGLPL